MNTIVYKIGTNGKKARLFVSGLELSRDLSRVVRGAKNIRTATFPGTTRKVSDGAFAATSIMSVVLNEGLEALGVDECPIDREKYYGVFQESGLRQVKFPSTLKEIGYRAFMDCINLNTVCFPEGLELLGKSCFSETGLSTVQFPKSLRKIAQASFCLCKSLKSAAFADGLEALGSDEYQMNGQLWYGVFQDSALENVRLPSTLRRIEYGTFANCTNLKDIQLSTALEYIGKWCFQQSRLDKITFPAGLKEVGVGAFYACKQLKDSQLNEGLEKLGPRETVVNV